MYVYEEKGDIVLGINVDDQLVIAEASLGYLKHGVYGPSLDEKGLNAIENGVLAFVGGDDTESYVDDEGVRWQEFTTNDDMLTCIYGIVMTRSESLKGQKKKSAEAFGKALKADYNAVQKNRTRVTLESQLAIGRVSLSSHSKFVDAPMLINKVRPKAKDDGFNRVLGLVLAGK